MKVRIDFTEDDLKKALGKYFNINPDKITFWYIGSMLHNDFCLEYEKQSPSTTKTGEKDD